MKENGNSGPSSLVYIQASESYPKKQLVRDDPSLSVPFPELSGESVEYLGKCSHAVLAISNFRFFALLPHAFINIPIMLIENLEWKGKELPELFLWCKDGQSFQLKFENSEDCSRWYERLKKKCITSQERLEDIFAFAFHAWGLDLPDSPVSDLGSLTCPSPLDDLHHDFLNEYKRMGFDRDNAWKITEINSKFELCPSYPKLHIVPSHITDQKLEKVAKFRTSRRFPSAVWRNRDSGCVIVRCSQPEVGWLYWRCEDDEHFLQTLGSVVDTSKNSSEQPVNGVEALSNGTDCQENVNGIASRSAVMNENSEQSRNEESSYDADENKKVLVIDCRSYTAAFANRAKGGGSECTEYYPNCKIQFMGLANIHSIRKSFQSLQELCCRQEEQTGWLSSLEATKWLFNISSLMKTALLVVKAIGQDRQHVVVHCSDGWDRTTQVVALAELLLDPFYRTIKGFRVLLEREWLAFGHKFSDRCGHGCQTDDSSERCPVFLQWLDCVHQLLRQFPCSFEFNETFLVKLAHHTYSCLFGTFLCNSEQERLEANIKHRTSSVWSLLDSQSRNFRNFLYSPEDRKVLYPEYQVRNLLLWSSLYLSSPVILFDMSTTNVSDTKLSGQQDLSMEHARSACDSCPSTVRRNSDGDVKSLISNSGDHCTPGSSFRDDTNSDLYLAKSVSCKSCSETNKIPGKGLISQGVLENPHQISDKDGKLSNLLQSDDTDENVFEDDSEQDIKKGAINGSIASSCGTLVEDSDCLKNVSESDVDKYCSNSEKETESDSTTETVRENLVYTNGDCDDLNDARSEISSTFSSYSNDHEDSCGYRSDLQGGFTKKKEFIETVPYNKIKKHLDVDGLAVVVDPVQSRLQELERNYRGQIDELQTQLQTQGCLCEPRLSLNSKQEVVSLIDSNFDGPKSLSSNATTDTWGSWEHVEDNDVNPTLWVPDHVAVRCCRCDASFSLTNRRHHCRSCGKVFCGSCCSDMAPVPTEQHYDPVRVCKSCYEKLQVLKLQDISVAAS